jgi:hypothetical protein
LPSPSLFRIRIGNSRGPIRYQLTMCSNNKCRSPIFSVSLLKKKKIAEVVVVEVRNPTSRLLVITTFVSSQWCLCHPCDLTFEFPVFAMLEPFIMADLLFVDNFCRRSNSSTTAKHCIWRVTNGTSPMSGLTTNCMDPVSGSAGCSADGISLPSLSHPCVFRASRNAFLSLRF